MFSPFDDPSSGGGGDIWSTGVFGFDSPLKDLLDSEDYTLDDLLEQDELLQELRGLHPQLIDYFGAEEAVAGLVRHIVRPPPGVRGSGSEGLVASGDAGAAGPLASDASPVAANLGRPRSLSEAERKLQEEQQLEEAQSALMVAPDIYTLKNRGSTDFGDPDFVADVGDQEEEEGEDEDGSSDVDGDETAAGKSGKSESESDKKNQESYWDEASSPSASPPPEGGGNDGGDGAGEKEKGSWMFDSTKDDDADIHKKTSKEERTVHETLELLHVRYPYMACEVICCEVAKILDVLVSGTVTSVSGTGGVAGGHSSQGSLKTVEEEGRDNEKETDTKKSDDGDRTLILDLLFGMITSTDSLTIDDRRAGYLEKILTVLFRTRPKEVTAYLNDRPHLLRDMINQCHSHSIGQIVQRLMLPPPPGRRSSQLAASGAVDEGASAATASGAENQDGDDDDGSPDSEQSQRAFGGSGGWPMISGMDDDDDLVDNDDDDLLDDEDEEMLTAHGPPGLDRSGWSENEEAVGWLLDRLTGEEPSSVNLQGRDRATSDVDSYWDDGGGRGRGDSRDDALLDAAQNSSEIIVAVVQNSLLTSPIVKSLTTEPNLIRLIDAIGAAPGLDGGHDAVNFFPASESTITLSMSVLESLVLQLGGYGAVSTPVEPEIVNLEEEKEGEGMELVLSSEPTGVDSRALGNGTATTVEVIDHLPKLLSALSALLCHKSTALWTSANSFSGVEARPTLGTARLRIVRLLESLVLLGNETVDSLLCKSPALELCLDLFWSFPWCSMLHQSVANLLVHVLEGGPERVDLQRYFINRCGLVRRLMESFDNAGPSPELTDPSAEAAALSQEAPGGEGDTTPSDGPNQPRYSEVMFALKEIGGKQHHASSVDSERGSDISDDEVLAVSEDDVEAAIEQQMLKVRDMEVASSMAVDARVDATSTFTDDEKLLGAAAAAAGALSTAVVSSSTSPAASQTNHGEFRMGYMGHVIIVCQALVHACSVGLIENDGEMANSTDGKDEKNDADSFDAEIDTVLPKVNGEIVSSSSLEQAFEQDAETVNIANSDPTEESDAEGDVESRKRKGRSFDSENSDAIKSSKQSSTETSPERETSEQEQSMATDDATPADDDVPGSFPTDPAQIQHPSEGASDRPPIVDIMMTYPLYDAWQSFVTTILASETAIQSTPLGGFAVAHPQEQMTSQDEHRVSLTEEDLKNFMGMNVEEDEEGGMGIIGGPSGVSIDLDDADLDIAASMMEALSMPRGANVASASGDEDGSGPPGHHRRNQVMAGFGAVVQAAPVEGGSQYIYDDPLGGGNDFDNDSSDEEEGTKDKEDDSNDTEDVPVLDLFAGNWEDAASPNDTAEADKEDGGWANFDDADAFAAAGLPEPTPLAPGVSGTATQLSEDTDVGDDVFASSPHLVDTLADER